MKNRRAIHRADCKRSEWAWWRWGRARSSLPDCRSNVSPTGATWARHRQYRLTAKLSCAGRIGARLWTAIFLTQARGSSVPCMQAAWVPLKSYSMFLT